MIRQLIRSIRRHFAGITQDTRTPTEKKEAALLSDMRLFIQAFEMSSTDLGRELSAGCLKQTCHELLETTRTRGAQ